MINLQIVENQLSELESVQVITFSNKTISLVVDAPMQALITLKTNIDGDCFIPLQFIETLPEGNKFIGDLVFTNPQINYLKAHPKKVLSFTVEINNEAAKGSFKCHIHPQLIDQFSTNTSLLYEIYTRYNKLVADLYKEKFSNPQYQQAEQPLGRGMVPVATGVGNEYKWDYPLNNIRERVLALSQLVLNLSEQNTQLTNRVNELESKVNEHVYEQYQL